ncbi:MAG: hypothetical protein M0033_10805 [Nitrospiraceae bacterium]|nr:hypothetical protein [Nitrospiraceae bacterium]
MKIVHVLKTEPGAFVRKVIEAHMRENEVRVFELYKGSDPDELLRAVEGAEKVFCW